MKKIIIAMILISLACSGNSEQDQKMGDTDTIPIQIQAIRDKDQILLSVQANSGFGIQMDAPNLLEATGIDGLIVKDSNLTFAGTPNPEKPEYYASIKNMSLIVEGEGKVQLVGKLFYCDYSKNICLPGKVHRTLSY
jgi:hypothetical protein